MTLAYKDFKEKYKELAEFAQYPEEFFEKAYRDSCLNAIRSYCNVFQGELIKNSDEDDLYNWAVTLATIFNIKEDSIGIIKK